jgi:copper transport protein
VVEGPGGEQVAGMPRTEEATLVAPLRSAGAGRYVVHWRVLAADGHVVHGSFAFTVAGEEDPAGLPRAPADAPPPLLERPAPPREASALPAPWWRWLTLIGLALFIGGSALRRPDAVIHPRVGLAALLGALLLLGGAAAELLHHSRSLAGSWDAALGTGTQRTIFASRWGQLWLLRVLGAGAALYLAVRARERTGLRAPPAGAALAVAGVVAAAMAGASHAATLPAPALFIALDALHRFAAALWVGGLLVLAMLLAEREGAPPGETEATLLRFSRWASWAIPLAVLSGLAPVLYRFADVRPPLSEPYLQLLLVKLALVGMGLALGAYHRWRVVRPLAAGSGGGVVSRARLTLGVEALLALLIILLAGSLAATPPPG